MAGLFVPRANDVTFHLLRLDSQLRKKKVLRPKYVHKLQELEGRAQNFLETFSAFFGVLSLFLLRGDQRPGCYEIRPPSGFSILVGISKAAGGNKSDRWWSILDSSSSSMDKQTDRERDRLSSSPLIFYLPPASKEKGKLSCSSSRRGS